MEAEKSTFERVLEAQQLIAENKSGVILDLLAKIESLQVALKELGYKKARKPRETKSAAPPKPKKPKA